MQSAVVLWTGGKDCCLALHLALESNFSIIALVTFVPSGNTEFQAHPQSEMRKQAIKLGLIIQFIEINEPYKASYIDALKWIQQSLGASVVITGDIDLIDGLPNWIEECCLEAGNIVYRPLWKKPREWIMDEIVLRKIRAKITFLNHSSLPKEWLNQIIEEPFLTEMKNVIAPIGIDLAGENGEYHTMVVDAPAMVHKLP